MNLKITRVNSSWVDQARSHRLYINSKKVADLRIGEEYECSLPVGSHTIQAKLDWCSSGKQEFTIKSSEHEKHIIFGTVPSNPISMLYHMFVGINKYIAFKQVNKNEMEPLT
ncbi:hypothetical protein ACG1BZ_09340 [Microbulbifer sp. CNSA002]|uniref:hypothetical protein n=1 Tax=Microbulbifer sp. CNSA002 TaxID=3373604 RepID=UPI0039B3BDC1